MTDNKIDRYEIKSELGRGGMASVLHGFDPRFKRDVAIKVLPPQFLHDPTFRARFEREAQTIAALEHPAIVPVYDYGEDQGQPYLVMRYMSGGSLTDRMARGPLSIAQVTTIVRRIGSALDETHAKGIIHRDLKPANILFDGRGDAFLSDFGIAKITEQASELTVEGTAMGTVQYMSPEQAEGRITLDGRSDIYALGALLFHLLTGQLPYQASTITAMILAHINQPVPHILKVKPDLPAACEAIISRAMAKNPADRYPKAGDVIEALLSAVGGPSTATLAEDDEGSGMIVDQDSTVIQQVDDAPTIMSSLTSAAKKRGGMFGKFLGQGIDKLKETTTVTLTTPPTPPVETGRRPDPYQLTADISVESPEDLPQQCELAWEPGFQSFKSGNLQRWMEKWQRYYEAEGETARIEVCQVYIKHSVNLRGQLHFKSNEAQQVLFEKFLRLLGGETPQLVIQPEAVDLGEVICTESGQTEIELRHAGTRGLISGQVTTDAPWLSVEKKRTSMFTSFLPGSKDHNIYLRPGEVSQVSFTAETETLKGGSYTAQALIKLDGIDNKRVAVSLTVNVDALLDPARHQSAAASEIVCRKILNVEPDRLQVKFMLAKVVTELGLQLVTHMPKQAFSYAQEAQMLLAEVERAGAEVEATESELQQARERLAKLQTGLGSSTTSRST